MSKTERFHILHSQTLTLWYILIILTVKHATSTYWSRRVFFQEVGELFHHGRQTSRSRSDDGCTLPKFWRQWQHWISELPAQRAPILPPVSNRWRIICFISNRWRIICFASKFTCFENHNYFVISFVTVKHSKRLDWLTLLKFHTWI